MILPKQKIVEKNLLKDYIGEEQFQAAGVDLSLKSVHEYKDSGQVDFDNKERKISQTQELSFDENGWVYLGPGSYKVIYNEYVHIPADYAALCKTRSTLLRSGAALETALWDPGYEGRSESMLVVHNKHGIKLKKNARIGQLLFIKLEEKTDEIYSGVYKGENK